MKIKKIEFKAYVDGKEIASTEPYELNHCVADECLDISNDIAMRVTMTYTEEADNVEYYE